MRNGNRPARGTSRVRLRRLASAKIRGFLVLFLTFFCTHAFAQREVGRVTLPYTSGNKLVHIEDVSPDRGSKPEGYPTYAMPWGVIHTVAISGRQDASSPATSWTTANGPVVVDHVAAVDPEGHLITFYWSPHDGKDALRTDRAGWKSVDLTEKTGKTLVTEQPCSWTVDAGSALAEHIAGRAANGHLFDFSWRPGKDWTALDVSAATNQTVAGPAASWTTGSGNKIDQNLAARSSKNELILFWRKPGASWQKLNLSTVTGRKIAGAPTGWVMANGTERISARGTANNLLLFMLKSGSWVVLDVTAKTQAKQKIDSRVTAWDNGGVQHIAARAPNDHLVVFTESTIDPAWLVQDVTVATNGREIVDAPVHWLTRDGSTTVTHLAAPGPGVTNFFQKDHVLLFTRKGTGLWSFSDLTATTNVRVGVPLTAWTTAASPGGQPVVEHLAAPTLDGRLHAFNSKIQPEKWNAVDVSSRSSGRIVYAGTPYAGVWISEDYGFSWHQSARPQPAVTAPAVAGALPVAHINDVAVSSADRNLVLAAADREGRDPSLAGIYRSTDRGRSWARAHTFNCQGQVRSVSQIVFAPDDPQRVYAAGRCGVAISTDAGANWSEVHPPGTATGARQVWHLAVSRRLSRRDEDRIVVAAGPNSIWLSREDGKTGSWILDPGATPAVLPRWFGSETGLDPAYLSAQLLALEPGNPNQVYLVHDTHSNGPSYHHDSDPTKSKYFGPQGVLSDIPVVYDTDQDNTFDAGEMVIDRGNPNPKAGALLADEAKIKFVDRNANSMLNNGEEVIFDTDNDNIYDQGEPVLARNGAASNSLRVNDNLADDARIKYVRTTYLGKESVYGPRHANIGGIWLGDLSKLSATDPRSKGEWTQLPGPPIYTGSGSSGAAAVYTHAMRKGFLVFMSDRASIQVSVGRPGAKGWQGWYRLAGLNGSEVNRYSLGQTRFVHPDPHGMAISPDFTLSLKRSTEASPYDLNAELDKCGGGRLWTSNDGGVYMNDDCAELDAESVKRRWQPAETGLNTLWTLNVVGSTKLDFKRALYTGTTHDDDFYSMDDGQTWKSPIWTCGDCDMWYGNLYDMNRILRLSPRNRNSKGDFDLFVETGNKAPDAGKTPESIHYLNGMRQFSISGNMIQGTRPVVQSYPNDTPPAKGDYVAIWQQTDTTRVLMRAHDSIDKNAANSGFTQVGPALPNSVDVVQVAGGHTQPIYFLGDGTHLWRGETDNRGTVPRWNQVVPSADGSVTVARRFFVNPWNPELLYLIDDNEVLVSTTRGRTWNPERRLTQAISASDAWQYTNCNWHDCLLNDMAFDPTNRNRRFAAGPAGVFFTADGSNWFRLLDTRALPSRPLSLWFDPISNQEDATLFVACIGRGILRLHPIPNQAPLLTMTIAGGGLDLAQPDWRRLGSAWLERTKKHSGDSSTGLGADNATFGSMHQAITVPCDAESATLNFWWSMTTEEGREGGDLLRAYVETENGVVSLLEAASNSAPRDVWTRSEVELREMGCGEMVVHFEAKLNEEAPTTFYIDDVELMVSEAERKRGGRITVKE